MSANPGHKGIRNTLRLLAPYLGGALFLAAILVLRHALRKYHYHEIIYHIRNLPSHDVLMALALTFAGYFVLTGYDAISINYIRRALPYRRTAFASYVAYALSHSIGVSSISGGGVRYRLYSSWGLSASEVAKVVMFNGITFWTGFSFIAGMLFTLRPMAIPAELHLPVSSDFYVGLLCLFAVSSYLFICAFRKRPVKVFSLEFEVPSIFTCFAQIGVSSLDWLIAGSVLFTLLKHDLHIAFFDFVAIFLFSQIAGLASQAPGGLGVFEMVALIMLSPYAPPASILGSLLVYRGVYYILPMIAGILMLGAQEALRKKEFIKTAALSASRAAPVLFPDLAGAAVFVSGATLLISGITPVRSERMFSLSVFLPLPAVEAAHIGASVLGIAMLFLARGLQRRIKNAYSMSAAALLAGAFFSLMRGFDYEEAIFLAVVLAGLLPFSRLFYRTEPLRGQPLSIGWFTAAGLTVALSAAVGFFVYRHAIFTQELLFRFGYYANDARFFRTISGAAAALVFISVSSLVRGARPKPVLKIMEDMSGVLAIACRLKQTFSPLVINQNVRFMLNDGASFLPVAEGVKADVCLGEPVGRPEERPDLVWHFLEYCRKKRPIFYDIPSESIQVYLDLGLSLTKVSEEARVPLMDNNPEIISGKEDGSDFKISEAGRGVVEAPLAQSLPFAILSKSGKLLAFAPVWLCEARKEITPLFIQVAWGERDALQSLLSGLFTWGKSNGWKWLNLGTAPLPARLHNNPAFADALRGLPYAHREHFASPAQLREFKERFNPVWEPRFIAMPPVLSPEDAVMEINGLWARDERPKAA